MSETGEPHRRRRRGAERPAAKPRPVLKAGLAAVGLALAAAVVVQVGFQTGAIMPTPAEQVSEARTALFAPAAQRDAARAESLARAALARQPLQSGAASLLAIVKEQAGDTASASRLMQAAGRLSHRDNLADFWLFEHDLKARRFDSAVLHADALLRRDFQTVETYLYPQMVTSFADPQFARSLAARLVKRPIWRARFLQFASAKLQNPGAAFVIFSALKEAGGIPTAEELTPYYRRLLADGKYDEAYLSWVLFLPQDTVTKLQNVYDGDFQGWRESPPFGWNFSDGVHGSIEPSGGYGRDGMALRVDYDGMTTPEMPSQILLLAPARYRLTALALTANPESAGRMGLSVACEKGEALMATTPVPDTRGAWAKVSGDFTVPEGCKGQRLKVVPIPGGQRAKIEVWLDQIAIDRVASDPDDGAAG